MRLNEIQQALREEDVQGWLFFDHHRRDPLAYRILNLDHIGSPTRRWYYFIPAEGEPRGLVHRVEPHTLDSLPGEHRAYSGWSSQVDGLKWLVGNCRRAAMQYSPECAIPYVSLVDAGTIELVRHAGLEEVVSSANLVQMFEARWTTAQLQMHMEAGRRVDRIRASAFQMVRTAVNDGREISEWDVSRFIREAFDKDGLVTDHGPIVAVNSNMSDPHYEPSMDRSRPIKKNDAVLIDMWAKLNQPSAVFYDITWTGFTGPNPPTELTRIFEVVRDARNAAVNCVERAVCERKVLHGFEVDDVARMHIQRQGYGDYFIHRTGHSIGEEVHGTGACMDNLETHDDRKIISRTCFSIEPGIYLPQFGVRSEVNVYVSDTEAFVTGEIQEDLLKLD